nr:unnamed protein product [Callosobruchus chinensis]
MSLKLLDSPKAPPVATCYTPPSTITYLTYVTSYPPPPSAVLPAKKSSYLRRDRSSHLDRLRQPFVGSPAEGISGHFTPNLPATHVLGTFHKPSRGIFAEKSREMCAISRRER